MSQQERIESDSLGERELPVNVLYGIHTARALENFLLAGGQCIRRLAGFWRREACLRIDQQRVGRLVER